MVVLLILTALHHFVVNRYINRLEKHLLLDKAADEEHQGLLSHRSSGRSIPDTLPLGFLDPLASLLEPRILAPLDDLRPYLQDPTDDDDIPHYSDDEIRNAYLNPALTSKMPKIWIPRDAHGVSREEIAENEAAGLATTDEGAELDEKGELSWGKDDFETVPIFKVPKKY